MAESRYLLKTSQFPWHINNKENPEKSADAGCALVAPCTTSNDSTAFMFHSKIWQYYVHEIVFET